MFSMTLRSLTLIFFLFILLSGCTGGFLGGNYQENLKKLDKVYGYCDNPQRSIKTDKREYKICKDKERAAGADGIVEEDFKMPFVDDLLNNRTGSGKIIYTSTVNQYLWSGSLNVLSAYTLRNVDSNGGYIETDWIYDQQKRCVIKIQINSIELISTGVETSLICQNEVNGDWVNDNENYLNEEKAITISILSAAQKYSVEDSANKK